MLPRHILDIIIIFSMLPRHILDIIIIFSLEQIMDNKCATPSCRSGYAKHETKHITRFHFPLKNFELNRLWIQFVNRKDWKSTKHKLHRSRWKVKFKMMDESHTNKTFQGAAKNTIIVTTNH